MSNAGNRYSVDGSYDLVWDRRFPIDGDILWPKDTLLQLRHFLFSSNFIEKRHILTLNSANLNIAEEQEPSENPPSLDIDEGYRFYTGKVDNERIYEVRQVARVELLRTLASTGIVIYVEDERGRSKRIFTAQEIGLSRAVIDVADECLRQGVVSPEHRLIPGKDVYIFRHQLMYREIERQFRRAASQAEYVMKGNHLSPEDFRRVVR